jgi:hypothetical protein
LLDSSRRFALEARFLDPARHFGKEAALVMDDRENATLNLRSHFGKSKDTFEFDLGSRRTPRGV